MPARFERGRLVEALREHARLLGLVGLFGCFGGAIVARVAVPLDVRASAAALIEGDVAGARDHATSDPVLDRARGLAGEHADLATLRARIDVDARGQRLIVTAHAHDEQPALRLADSLVTALVSDENVRRVSERAEAAHALDEDIAAAKLALAQATEVLAAALTREGRREPEAELSSLRARIEALDAQILEARTLSTASSARGDVMNAVSRTEGAQRAAATLAEAQRALSVLLAQGGEGSPDVIALRQRIKALQARAVAPGTHAAGERAEARAAAARAKLLERERATLASEHELVSAVASRIAPARAAHQAATDRLAWLEMRKSEHAATTSRAEVAARASIVAVERRGLRWVVALACPLFALVLGLVLIAIRELKGFRVCTAAELAHWLGVPVVTSSTWPKRDDALESLVDELFDASVEAQGVTLVLPMSELERPLALTLAARLNTRAQRHFRSPTGARVTIAQAWEGEIGGSRTQRAAEAADRVLWVVVADQYRGQELRVHGSVIKREAGVAAVLVDAPARGLARSSGDVMSFWSARSEPVTPSAPPSRVAVH